MSKTMNSPQSLKGNTRFERIKRCGYNPQTETLGCDVEIRRRNGYGFAGGNLSWAIPPANCNTRPIFGKAINFTARRDP